MVWWSIPNGMLPNDTIKNSFKICGLAASPDGSEDDQILCFRPDGFVPEGYQLLKNVHAELSLNSLTNKIDEINLLQDEENGLLSDDSIEF